MPETTAVAKKAADDHSLTNTPEAVGKGASRFVSADYSARTRLGASHRWNSAPAGTAACASCGAVYEVTITRVSVQDNDQFDCAECGRILRKWNDTAVPSFKRVAEKH